MKQVLISCIQFTRTSGSDFDFVEFKFESEELSKNSRECRQDDHLGDIIEERVGREAWHFEWRLQFLQWKIKIITSHNLRRFCFRNQGPCSPNLFSYLYYYHPLLINRYRINIVPTVVRTLVLKEPIIYVFNSIV